MKDNTFDNFSESPLNDQSNDRGSISQFCEDKLRELSRQGDPSNIFTGLLIAIAKDCDSDTISAEAFEDACIAYYQYLRQLRGYTDQFVSFKLSLGIASIRVNGEKHYLVREASNVHSEFHPGYSHEDEREVYNFYDSTVDFNATNEGLDEDDDIPF